MILTDYYKFKKKSGQTSKTRIDCISSTQSYNGLERFRNKAGELKVYIGRNTYTAAGEKGASELSISYGEHISSVYIPNIEKPFAFGDTKGTSDALLFVIKDFSFINGCITEGAEFEIFVARGQSRSRRGLYDVLLDGGLNEEIKGLRQRAVAENATERNV